MPGDLSLAFCREPSYLSSCAHCGPPRRVLVATDKGQVVALCSFFLRSYQWMGRKLSVWMLSDFRALPQHAAKSITGRGWRAIRDLLEGHPAMLSVVRDNLRAHKLFTKSRPGWPTLAPIGSLCTNISPLWENSFKPGPYRVDVLHAEQVLAFTNRRKDPISPLVEGRDFGSVLPEASRFWGVYSPEGGLLGCAGLSEPLAYRQIRIHAYSGFFGMLYRLCHALRLPLLPVPGSLVPLSTACLLSCPHPVAFQALFEVLKRQARLAGSRFLVWCMAGSARTRLWDNLRFRYRSDLYQLLWPGERPLPAVTGPLGYEIAWL